MDSFTEKHALKRSEYLYFLHPSNIHGVSYPFLPNVISHGEEGKARAAGVTIGQSRPKADTANGNDGGKARLTHVPTGNKSVYCHHFNLVCKNTKYLTL